VRGYTRTSSRLSIVDALWFKALKPPIVNVKSDKSRFWRPFAASLAAFRRSGCRVFEGTPLLGEFCRVIKRSQSARFGCSDSQSLLRSNVPRSGATCDLPEVRVCRPKQPARQHPLAREARLRLSDIRNGRFPTRSPLRRLCESASRVRSPIASRSH
jgi:hypothetical protein